jgi:cell division transport system permease protein
MAGEVIATRFWRRLWLVIALHNLFDLVLLAGCRNWLRNFSASFAALGSISLLAMLAGVGGLTALALANLSSAQAAQASVLHVYLADSATSPEVAVLRDRLAADKRVQSVTFISKADALVQAQRRPGMEQLVNAANTNPFPASLEVRVRSLGDIRAVAAGVASDPAVDPQHVSSYDAESYSRLQFAFRTGAIAGTGLLLLLIIVAAGVTAGSIRGTLLARREEVEVMWLVGSARWVIGGPFLVEGALTGGMGAALGGLVAFSLGLLVLRAEAGAFSVFLPGVTVAAMATLLLVLIGSGVGLGSFSALVGVRDLRR